MMWHKWAKKSFIDVMKLGCAILLILPFLLGMFLPPRDVGILTALAESDPVGEEILPDLLPDCGKRAGPKDKISASNFAMYQAVAWTTSERRQQRPLYRGVQKLRIGWEGGWYRP
jgi:hypothetical protein